MKVAIQGELGSFSHEAAERIVPKATILPCASSAEVFDLVEKGAAAVIPIENTLAGSVAEHYDLLLARKVYIEREFRLRIIHNLIGFPGVKLARLVQVFSHPVALDQCRNFFRAHPNIRPSPFYDTAGAVKHVVQQRLPDAAAIAGRLAAKQYKADILKRELEDNPNNYTRFFLIRHLGRTLPVLKGANKASVAFSLKNEAGALYRALSVFALRGISLSKIESRPVPGRPWEYVFYVDFLRGRDSTSLSTLRHLEEFCESVKVLGFYPEAK